MRFFKIFLIGFGSLIGAVGIALGGMFLAGEFTKTVVQPESIAFEQTSYDVAQDFEMTITTNTPDVTENEVALSFLDAFTQNEQNITDGIVTVPKTVTIGIPFTVSLNKENKLIGDERIAWIKGGISNLKATSTNVNARIANTSVCVDVPVHSIIATAKSTPTSTAQTIFNIDSNFVVEAEFVPAESAYKFSKDGSDGNEVEYKNVFFSSLSSFLSLGSTSTYNSQTYHALEQATGVDITAQVFSSISDELAAYEAVSSYETEELKHSQILAILDTIQGDKKAESSISVDFASLEVGSYSMTNVNLPSIFNQSVRLFANKQTSLESEFNLGVTIIANDDSTILAEQISNIGIAVVLEGSSGYQASTTEQFLVNARNSIEAPFYEQELTFYFPYLHQTDLNESYWDIVCLGEEMTAKLLVVLFEQTDEGLVPHECALTDETPTFILNVNPTREISSQIYWSLPDQTITTLYVYDNIDPTQTIYQQYDLKNLSYIIPNENSYKTVLYFAYIEKEGGEIATTQNEYIGNYISVGNKKVKFTTASQGIVDFYEIPNGVITPKGDMDFPDDWVIKVVMATVKTTYNGVFLFDNDYYVVDRFSSISELGTLQALSFEVAKTLKSVDSHIKFSSEIAVNINSTFAVVHGTPSAFDVVFDIPQDQQSIFVRDWNDGRIGFVFKINGNIESRLFTYEQVAFVYDELVENDYFVSVNVDYLIYETNDPGYRNFTVEVFYRRGYEEPVFTQVASGEWFDFEENQSSFVDEAIFEVYDGKIDILTFAYDLSVVTNENPICVKTSLQQDDQIHSQQGISYAAVGSTNSFTHDEDEFDQTLLFEDETNDIAIIAFDKYGKEILDKSLWTLTSGDLSGKVLNVDSSGQSLNFLGNSASPVFVGITSTNGIGGREVNSSYGIYFDVETLGRMVMVSTNITEDIENEEIVFSSYDKESYDEETNTFVVDEQKDYNFSTLSFTLPGKKNRTVYLTEENQLNLLKLYYALPNEQGRYQIFDLLKITKFVREDGISFEGFITFNFDESGNIKSFTIDKDFGQTGYLNLKAQTDIGINLTLQIEITPNINVLVGEYGHESDGASGGYQNSIHYTGVYARHEILVNFDFSNSVEGSVLDIVSYYTPLLYDYSNNTIIAIEGQLVKLNEISATETRASVSFYIADVTGVTFVHYVFVLDSSNSIGELTNYVKNVYDYSRDLYLRVNPNISASLNSGNENVEIDGVNSTIRVATANIITVVGITSAVTDTLIVADRIVGVAELSQNKTTNNYVVAKITNELGQNVLSQYFSIVENQLTLLASFQNSQTIYISLLHYVNATQFYKVKTFCVTVIPDIIEEPAHENNFVVYDGIKYLQLESGIEYYFLATGNEEDQDIVSNFTISKTGVEFNLNISFDFNYVSESAYWQISGNRIYIKTTTQILANRIWVNVEIMGVAKINYPVIIMPKKAPLVAYDTQPNSQTSLDLTHTERNMAANSDLANLLSIEYLVENDIYDVMPDGLAISDGVSVLASLEKTTGIYVDASETVLYTILDGDGGFNGTDIVLVNAQGIISTSFVGEDKYMIIVASVKGLNIYYRIKIISSLILQTFYPYADNMLEDEIKAEYILNTQTDSAKVVTFNTDFSSEIPATSQKIDDVVELVFDEQSNTNIYQPVDTYITNRLMMFRSILLESGEAKVLMNYAIESIMVYSIEVGLMTDVVRQVVEQDNFSSYVLSEYNETLGKIDITFKNVGSYVTVLEIKTTSNAIAYYTFAVEQTNRVYQMVVQEASEYISEMEILSDTYSISIDSPNYDSENPIEPNISYELDNKYLRLVSGASSQNRTDILRYHIVNDKDNLLSVGKFDEKTTIFAEYSVNTIYASLIFYTKYGEVKSIPLTLQSLITVAFESDTIFANTVFDLQTTVTFEEAGVEPSVQWLSAEFVGEKPLFVDKVSDNRPFTFVILPIEEGSTEKLELLVKVVINYDDVTNAQPFEFICSFDILSSISAIAPDYLNIEPISTQNFALGEVIVDVFNTENAFFTNTAATIELTSQDNSIFGVIDNDYQYKYTLNVTVIGGANAVGSSRMINEQNKLVLSTNAVAVPTQVVLSADLRFEEGTYEFICTSYLSFILYPDTSVELNYPAPDGTELEFESVFYNDAIIEFDSNAAFQTPINQRVSIETLDGTDLSGKEIYVTYSIVGGDANLIVSGGVVVGDQPGEFDFNNSAFRFEFEDTSTFTFATVDFEIFVSGISRAIYTVRVYKNISSVYGIQINTINEIDGRNEVFYIGEDRRDIFNGVQAFQYTINSELSEDTVIRLFKNNSGSLVNLAVTFNLLTAEKGVTKTQKVNHFSDLLSDLTLENVRFTIDGGTTYYTLAQMSPYFAIDTNSIPSFKVVRRVIVTYLGIEVYNPDFLSRIQLLEEAVGVNSSGFSTFNLSFEGLGGQIIERLDNLVEVFIGTSTIENTLGVYYYSVKVNLVVENCDDTIEIMVGEQTVRMLDVLGVKKQNGIPFVTYDGANAIIDNLIKNKQLELFMSFKLMPNEHLELYYANNPTLPYEEHYQTIVEPLQYSVYRGYDEVLGYYNYDFSMLASGAPNPSILGTILFEYTYNDEFTGDEFDFVQEITVKINPNWSISLVNGAGGDNTALTPEIITSDYFGMTDEYTDILVDPLNPIYTKIFAYRTNNIEAGNRAALDFNYTVVYPEDATGIAQVSGASVKIFKSDFAQREICIRMNDVYGYEAFYFYVVQPENIITYSGISGSSIYEGDTMLLQYEGYSVCDEDHLVILSSNISKDTAVSYTLCRADTGEDLNAINQPDSGRVDSSFSIKYIDGTLFSSVSKTLQVYMKIHLQQLVDGIPTGDIYTIKGGNFYLHQRYGAVVGNVNVRDGYETNLINHVQVYDYKQSSNIGEPMLENEKTLQLSNPNFVGTIIVSAYNESTTKPIQISVSSTTTDPYRFYMIAENANGAIEDLNNYNYVISSIADNSGLTISVVEDCLSITGVTGEFEYIVHLTNGTEYKDIILTNEQTSANLGSTGYSILGYEITGLALQVKSDVDTQNVFVSLTANYGFKVTLVNRGTINGNINKLTLTQNSEAPWATVDIENNLGVKVEDVPIVDNKIELQGSGYDYTGNGEDWYISKISYANGFEPYKFQIRDDKKMSIVTVVNMIGAEYETVDVNFNGIDEKIIVELDKNGKQVFSLIESFGMGGMPFDPAAYSLSSTNPIGEDDLVKVKGMTYYNDTLELIFGSANRMVNMNFRLYRVRNSVETYKDFSVTLKAYKFTYALGLSKMFEDMIKEGDIYSLKVVSVQTVELQSLQVKWPDYVTNPVELVTLLQGYLGQEQYGSYTVDISNVTIVDGKTTITLDSLLQYNNDAVNRLVTVSKYYIIEFKDAFYVLDSVDFKVSPYYYGIDTSDVYSTEGGVGQRIITDYQQKTSGDDVSYTVAFETWAGDIYLTDSLGNCLVEDLVAAKALGRVIFSMEDGGSGQGGLDIVEENITESTFDLITEDIQTGLVYFTINVLVALNGDGSAENVEWLQIASILLGFDSNPQYFLQPKDELNNRIGYTVAIDQEDELLVRYVEIDGSDPMTFSINSLFAGEYIDSYDSTRTSVANLSNVYLTQKTLSTYKIAYPVNYTNQGDNTLANKLTAYILLDSTYIAAGKPVITAINVKNGDNVVFNAVYGESIYTGTYNHSGDTLYGTILLENIEFKDDLNNIYTYDTLPGGIENYLISTNSTNVAVVWSQLDLTELNTMLNAQFFGDGLENTAAEIAIANVFASKVFRITNLGGMYTAIEDVDVFVDDRGELLETTEYYAITQLNTILDNNVTTTNYAQSHVYMATNSTTLTKRETIALKPWNNQYFGDIGLGTYSSVVIVEKLSSLIDYSGPSMIGMNGYYSHSFGTLESGEYIENIQILQYIQNSDIIDIDYKEELLVDFFDENGDVSIIQPAIYTKILSSVGIMVTADISMEPNEYLNIVRKVPQTGGFEFIYEYHTNVISTMVLPVDQVAVVLKPKQDSNSLIWHEYIDQDLPLDAMYYAKLNGENWEVQQPVYQIGGLVDGDIIGKIWNGTFENTEDWDDDAYLQLTYGQEGDPDYEKVYFRVGDHKYGRAILVGDMFKQAGDLIPLDVSRFGLLEVMTDNISNYISSVGINLIQYAGQTYSILDYTDQTYSLFDVIKQSNEGVNTFTFLRSSLVETIYKVNTSALGWSIDSAEMGFYAFEQKDKFVIVDLRNTTGYNLFTIFDTDLILNDDGDITLSKLANQLYVYQNIEDEGVETVNVKLTNGINSEQFNTVSVIYDIEQGGYVVLLTNLYDKQIIQNLVSTLVTFYQTDAFGAEVFDDNGYITRIITHTEGQSLVEYDQNTLSYKIVTISVGELV